MSSLKKNRLSAVAESLFFFLNVVRLPLFFGEGAGG
jgi:hypothetical protein